jgi:DNA sulfur modification protein DndD
MIRRLQLRSWKAYDELDLALAPGTSFIVAANGVGKTSLLQALHFGMFGDNRLLGSKTSVEQAVRGDENSIASVTLEVDLEGRLWTIHRAVPRRLKSTGTLQQAEVSVDGNAASQSDWDTALATASGVGLTELKLLSAIGEGGTIERGSITSSDRYDIVRHLSDVLGVNKLRNSSASLSAYSKRVASEADKERRGLREQPVQAARNERDRVDAEREALAAELRRLQESTKMQQELLVQAQNWTNWHRNLNESREIARFSAERLATVLRTVLSDLQTEMPEMAQYDVTAPDSEAGDASERVRSLKRSLDQLREMLNSIHEQLLRQAGEAEGSIKSAKQALDLLTLSGPVCPTCRRPISPAEAEQAVASHTADIESAGLRKERLEGQVAAVKRAISRISSVEDVAMAPPPPRPAGEDTSKQVPALVEALRPLQTKQETLNERIRDLVATVGVLDRNIAAANADDDLRNRLILSYREADIAELTAGTLARVADEICSERITPISTALSKRFSELWPGRPALHLDINSGEMFGEASGNTVDLSNMSGGERAVATVLLRLLALQSASTAPVLLLDEPLEHLDPRNRRLLASLLVAATSTDGYPRQILVTTYEESVTRGFGAAGDETSRSHVVYVSSKALQ